jgi:hypothetical protein
MNIRGLVGALLPVFFVLALGYIAGKRRSFNAGRTGSARLLQLPPCYHRRSPRRK